MPVMSRFLKLAGLALGIGAMAVPVCAQSAAAHVALGDAARDQRKPVEARAHFLQAIAADPAHYEALLKAARVETDLAETAAPGVALDSLIAFARTHAEAAIQIRPNDAEGHFSLARAMGRKALSVGVMDRIRYSTIVRSEALEALTFDSTHAGALHVLGMWNAEIMRVSGLARAFARTFLGARVFALANWDDAQRLLEASVQRDPRRIVHWLDLAGIYADRGNSSKARALYEGIAMAPIAEINDELYKRQAAERIRKL